MRSTRATGSAKDSARVWGRGWPFRARPGTMPGPHREAWPPRAGSPGPSPSFASNLRPCTSCPSSPTMWPRWSWRSARPLPRAAR
ncbi:MAG: hypothetical protein AMK75_01615 [Planctomycetes bacterium SM23_65]|nr:MAG: hypothetical protein AMK75_01615 [Planctomycetes bacterium SM23_65]